MPSIKASFEADVARSLAEAHRAWELFQASHNVFMGNLQRNEYEAAELERERMKVALDDYLDQHSAAHKRLQVANG